jgi:hypothetical protein
MIAEKMTVADAWAACHRAKAELDRVKTCSLLVMKSSQPAVGHFTGYYLFN